MNNANENSSLWKELYDLHCEMMLNFPGYLGSADYVENALILGRHKDASERMTKNYEAGHSTDWQRIRMLRGSGPGLRRWIIC